MQSLRSVFLPVISALAIILAFNPFGIPEHHMFGAAAALVAMAAYLRSAANGIFLTLLFNFSHYSMHAHEWGTALINAAIMAVISLSAEGARNLTERHRKETNKASEADKAFMNKVLNSLMFAHDMLWQIKNSNDPSEVRRIFSANMMNIMGVSQVICFGQQADGRLRALYSSGAMEKGTVMQEVTADSFHGHFGKSIPARKCPAIGGSPDGYCMCVPLKDKEVIKEITVFYKTQPFDESDVYIAEFFAAQVFIITEKHDLFSRLSLNYEKIIEALSIAIDTKDHETHGHSLATMFYAMKIAEKLGLADAEIQKIKYASLLHDIGKINISTKILNKPSSLTDEEFDVIKKHPEEGAGILNKMNIFDEIIPIILYHHERYDGKGYPQKLKGDAIPLGSRICAIADAYSVMRSDRPYRKALTKEAAVGELKKCAGSQFDEKLVNVFLQVIEEDDEMTSGTIN